MVKLFILIKRKGTKRFLGAIPTKKGATRSAITKKLRTQLKPGFSAKIVTKLQLRQIVEKQKPRKTVKKKRVLKKRRIKKRKR